MKWNLTVITIIIFIKVCSSQIQYKHLFSRGAQGKLYELDSGNILYCFGGGFARLDQSGLIYAEKNFNIPSIIVEDLLKLTDNEIFLCGEAVDTCASSPTYSYFQPAVTKVDSEGVVIWSRYFKIYGACGAQVFSSNFSSNYGVILCGGNVGSPQIVGPNSFVLRTDSAGHLLWSKYFYNHHGGAQFAAELSDKSVIAGLNIDSGGAVLARLDSVGNLLWSKSYVRPRGFLHSILPESDGTFLVTGTTDSLKVSLGQQYPPWFHPRLFLMKLDTSGQVLWAKEYDDSTDVQNYFTLDPSKVIKLTDGSYMIYGGKVNIQRGVHQLIMLHVDVNGDLIWTIAHGPVGFLNQCQYIIQTSDGGFLMSEGTIGNYPNGWQGAYELIKTDSMGHSTGCFEYTENINVYPYFPLDSDVVLLSIDGATEYTANVRDTSYGPTVMYDECVLLTSGNPFVIDKSRETIAYPSPTTGKFAVRSQPPQQNKGERYLTVYDSMGRIVLQKQITEKEDTPVDLSKQKKGIYLIRILEGEKVSESKVVVE